MARTGFSQEFLNMCYYADTQGSVIAIIVQVSHPSWSTPFYFTNQIKGLTSSAMGGGTQNYVYRWFEFPPPNELTDSTPTLSLTFDDTDLVLGLACFTADTQFPFDCSATIVVKDDPNRAVVGPFDYRSTEDAHDEGICVFTANLDYGLNEIYPAHAMTPASHPGLVGGTGI